MTRTTMPRTLRAWEGFILHRWRRASVLRRPPTLSSSCRSPFLIKPLQTKYPTGGVRKSGLSKKKTHYHKAKPFCSADYDLSLGHANVVWARTHDLQYISRTRKRFFSSEKSQGHYRFMHHSITARTLSNITRASGSPGD